MAAASHAWLLTCEVQVRCEEAFSSLPAGATWRVVSGHVWLPMAARAGARNISIHEGGPGDTPSRHSVGAAAVNSGVAFLSSKKHLGEASWAPHAGTGSAGPSEPAALAPGESGPIHSADGVSLLGFVRPFLDPPHLCTVTGGVDGIRALERRAPESQLPPLAW